jgi:glycosyltransferase involved in cell wall biosynthesis
MKKTYIIYYEWKSTAGNHAGMAHLFRTIKQWNKENVYLIKIPSRIGLRYFRYLNWILQILYSCLLVLFLYIKTNKNNNIFFTEFFVPVGHLDFIAKRLRKWKTKAQLYGLAHLSEKHLLEIYDEAHIERGLMALDKIVVLGSSLGEYFNRLGFDNEKIVVTFHYLDNSYYKPAIKKNENQKLRVIAMGALKRNHADLRTIVAATPDIDYDICQGNLNLKELFSNLNNVTLHGFLSEENLLHLMQQADIGISVLDDTVGSNVITTSLACGLVQVVSDVGSIRDYCNTSNTFFCKSIDDFINALTMLKSNRELIKKMSFSALEQSKEFEIEKFNAFLVDLMK